MVEDQAGKGLFLESDLNLISELQAPLLGIAANARVASSRLNGSDAKIAEYLDAIEFSSKSLIRTIDVLIRSRDFDNNILSLEMEPIHIGLSIEEAITKLAPLCRVQAQIFSYKAPRNAVITANRECLELALYHIFEQALRSSATEEIIGVSLSSNAKLARLSIKASGGRERATQLRNGLKNAIKAGSGKDSARGFGVNFSLAASSKLIEFMGGSFSISQRKDGISFNLSLPISRQGELFT